MSSRERFYHCPIHLFPVGHQNKCTLVRQQHCPTDLFRRDALIGVFLFSWNVIFSASRPFFREIPDLPDEGA
jgi:hypothetical protein